METLPVEMVEMIVRQLTPQDLARCSAVCREWREIFTKDWVWKPHCDSELEEPLRTTPCVATPAFMAPEAENSTLAPISRWKLAFMREKHLWKNWRSRPYKMNNKNEHVTKFDNKDIKSVDFLTDTIVVVWYSNHIEIFDVSVLPAALVATTDNSVNIGELNYCHRVIGPATLLVEKQCSIQVLDVDISNETIKLKHTIPLTRNRKSAAVVVKEQVYLCLDDESLKLKIFDLNTGKLLKEEPSPEKITQNERVYFRKIKSSLTSDFVACQVIVVHNSNGMCYCKYYVYSLKQLAFLPGPVAEYAVPYNYFALLGHWLATGDYDTVRVYNFQTREVLLSHEHSKRRIRCLSGKVKACNDSFVFTSLDDSEHELSKLYIYFPSNRSLTILCEVSNVGAFSIINNKLIELQHDENSVSVWKHSGQVVEKCDFSVRFGYKTNRSFTKVLNRNYLKEKSSLTINYLW